MCLLDQRVDSLQTYQSLMLASIFPCPCPLPPLLLLLLTELSKLPGLPWGVTASSPLRNQETCDG